MSEIEASEAKTDSSRLLKRVREGERFVITEQNRPVAEFIPIRQRETGKIRAAIENLKAFQETHSLAGSSFRQMIEEGRK